MGFLFHGRCLFLYLVDPLILFIKFLLLHIQEALGKNRNENCPIWRASLAVRAGCLSAFKHAGSCGHMYLFCSLSFYCLILLTALFALVLFLFFPITRFLFTALANIRFPRSHHTYNFNTFFFQKSPLSVPIIIQE